MLGFFNTISLRQEQRFGTELTVGQILSTRLSLILALRGVNYRPKGKCTGCGKMLTHEEILKGFRSDPLDYKTECPRCETRFVSQLSHRSETGASEALLTFYCADQVLHEMKGLHNLEPKEIEKRNPSVFHSAIAHFGNLKNIFKELDVEYAKELQGDWKTKVEPFLGKLPDTIIARCIGVAPSTIGRWRRKAKNR